MPSRHKRNPLTVRLPEGERSRLEDHAARTGRKVNQVVVDAVREKLDREQPESLDAAGNPPAETEVSNAG